MKHLLLSIFSILWFLCMGSAQNPDKKCWYIDYYQWNENTPALHILCGNDDAFNTGDELTLEMWVRAYTFGENRKVMGKIDSDGSGFNNGYVMGFQNLNVYTEIWNPTTQVITYGSAGPIQIDSAFVHMATTYSTNSGMMRDYINGVKVGETQIFPANPIEANNAEFMIGAAPWDPFAFQFYGALDEVRVWNVERSQEQLQKYMFQELQGDEEGLVAYYNFNTAYDNVVPDMSQNNNTGILQNASDLSWSWAPSHAPVGDLKMYDLHDRVAAWSGKLGEEFNYAMSNSGLSVIADIQRKEFEKYVLFAHDGENGTSTQNEPDGNHQGFQRTHREWYLNQSGNPELSVFLNLGDAAGEGTPLPQTEEKDHYALLFRENKDMDFIAIAFPNQIYQDNLIFNNLILQDGYYTLGYSESSFELVTDITNAIFQQVMIYPNPANAYFTIANAPGSFMHLYNLSGQIVMRKNISQPMEKVNTKHLPSGIYIIKLQHNNHQQNQRIVIQN